MNTILLMIFPVLALSLNTSIDDNLDDVRRTTNISLELQHSREAPKNISVLYIKKRLRTCHHSCKHTILGVRNKKELFGTVDCIKLWLHVVATGDSNKSGHNGTHARKLQLDEVKDYMVITELKPLKTYTANIRCITANNSHQDSISISFKTQGPEDQYQAYVIALLFGLILMVMFVFFVIPENFPRFRLKPNFTFKGKRLADITTTYSIEKENILEGLLSAVKNASNLKRQFEELEEVSPKYDDSYAQSSDNIAEKNRYADILPFNYTRVVLKEIPGDTTSNYINASYIENFNSNIDFITCQGPMQSTVGDFWRMVWQRNVYFVVMLTDCIENGKDQSFRYWPHVDNEERISYLKEGFLIHTVSRVDECGYLLRKITITKGSKKREITHWMYCKWQDKDCPRNLQHLLTFVLSVRATIQKCETNSHLVVHCSAGIGRTGTFLTIMNLINILSNSSISRIDIFMEVLLMRHYRRNMVQTESQYAMIYKVFLLYISTESKKKGEINDEKYKEITDIVHFKIPTYISDGSEGETSFVMRS